MLTICDRSALARWGERGLAERLGDPCHEPGEWSLPAARYLNQEELRAVRMRATPERPLHVLVDSRAGRIRSSNVVSHVWSTPLPKGALYQLSSNIYLASPEFCLQQMAPRRGVATVAALCMEVCGDYACSPWHSDGFRKRAPLSDPGLLREHFEEVRGYGSARVREALGLTLPGSRSPMETVVVLLFTLPVELGGCGLPAPRLNYRLEIPPELQLALGKPYVTVDLCWPEVLVILEYDSYRWHSDKNAVDSDASRNEGLRDEGWMVRSVTKGMLVDPAMRAQLVNRVMERFGRRLPTDEAFRLRQQALVEELLRA